MEKRAYREQMQQYLHTLTDEAYKTKSAHISTRLLQHIHIIEGKTIAVTMSNRPEVDTTPIIEQLWQLGKDVVIPKCLPKTREMLFYRITSFDDVQRAYANILEPIVTQTTLVTPEEIDCIIVPGIVFDRAGYRIGFGGGYYDRFLQHRSTPTIALAFQEQIVEVVPTNEYDIPVDYIVTDKEQIVCTSVEEGTSK